MVWEHIRRKNIYWQSVELKHFEIILLIFEQVKCHVQRKLSKCRRGQLLKLGKWNKKGAYVNTAHILAQPHQNYNYINCHSEPSQIELNGSLTTIDLKKPHPSRLVGGAETQNKLVPHVHEVDKNLDISGTRSPSPSSGQSAQGTSVGKMTAPNFWLQKPAGIELVEETPEAPSISS